MKRVSVVAMVVMVCVAACAPPTATESPEIMARSGEWTAALNAGDLETLVAMYTADARVLPPNADMGQGSEAVRASFGEMIDAGLTGELGTIEAYAAGDVGVRVGTFKIFAPDGSVVDRGKFIEAWRRVDGEWKIANDIWNSDMPVASPIGTTLAVTHQVKDFERWMAAWRGEDSGRAMFAQHGVSGVHTLQSMDKPNHTGLLVEVTDMEAFQAFMASPEAEASKNEYGVIDASMRVFSVVE